MKTTIKLVLLMCLEFLMGNCAHMPGPAPLPHPGATCASVCAHEQILGCEWAKPTAKGATCTDVCDNIYLSGVVTLDLPCMDAAPTCAAISECSARTNN